MLGFGAWGIGWTKPEEGDGVGRLLNRALDLGINLIDSSAAYRWSEELIAKYVGHRRDEFIFATKCGSGRVLQPDGEWVQTLDYSAKAIAPNIDRSLERLKTDHVDILLIHDPDEGATLWSPGADPFAVSHFADVMEQTYPVLDDLRSQNVIKAIGLGMNQWQMLCDFARAADFDCFLLAGRYTLLEQNSAAELLPLCQERNIRIVIGGPYNSGILASGAVDGAYYNYAAAPDEILEKTRQIEAVCRRHGVALAAAALQFPFGHPAVAAVIPGARSVSELEANVLHFATEIPSQMWQELRELGLLHPEAPLPA